MKKGLLLLFPRRHVCSGERGLLSRNPFHTKVHKYVILAAEVWISLWKDLFFDTRICGKYAENKGLWIKKPAVFVKTMKVN